MELPGQEAVPFLVFCKCVSFKTLSLWSFVIAAIEDLLQKKEKFHEQIL